MAFPPAGSGTRTSCAEDLPEDGPRQIASAQAAGESAKRIQRSYRAGLLPHPEVYDNKDVMILPLPYRKNRGMSGRFRTYSGRLTSREQPGSAQVQSAASR